VREVDTVVSLAQSMYLTLYAPWPPKQAIGVVMEKLRKACVLD